MTGAHPHLHHLSVDKVLDVVDEDGQLVVVVSVVVTTHPEAVQTLEDTEGRDRCNEQCPRASLPRSINSKR